MNDVDSYYSWVVALASCLIFLLVSFPVRLGAQLFVSLLNHYNTSRKEASFPFVLAYIVRCASGPFAGILGKILNLQRVTILGCSLCALGVVGCFFAEDVLAINICLGLIYGIGYGLSSALIPLIINQHFKKHRNKAYGIFLSGSGFGSFVAPPILDLILSKFGMSGTFLIMGALIFNSVPAAMLLTAPIERRRQREHQKLLDGNKVLHEVNNKDKNSLNESPSSTKIMGRYFEAKSDETLFEEFNILLNKTTDDTPEIKFPNRQMEQDLKNHESASESIFMNENLNVETKRNSFCDLKAPVVEFNDHQNEMLSDIIKDNDIVFKKRLNSHKKSLCDSISILWSPEFQAIAFIEAVTSYVMQVFWTITVDFVRDKGIEQHLEVYFVMCLSLFDTVGRLVLGSITDKGFMTIKNFSVSCFGVIGLICLLLILLPELFSLMAVFALTGLTLGGCVIAGPALITEFIEGERRETAMASRLVFTPLLSFTISPLIGYFRGSIGSYNGLLYVMASMCLVCVTLLLLLPLLTKRSNRIKIKSSTRT